MTMIRKVPALVLREAESRATNETNKFTEAA